MIFISCIEISNTLFLLFYHFFVKFQMVHLGHFVKELKNISDSHHGIHFSEVKFFVRKPTIKSLEATVSSSSNSSASIF